MRRSPARPRADERQVDRPAADRTFGAGVRPRLDQVHGVALIRQQAGQQWAGQSTADDRDALGFDHVPSTPANAASMIEAKRWHSSKVL